MLECGPHFAPTCLSAARVAQIRFLDFLSYAHPCAAVRYRTCGHGLRPADALQHICGLQRGASPPHSPGACPRRSHAFGRLSPCSALPPALASAPPHGRSAAEAASGVNDRGWRRLRCPSSLASSPTSCLPAARELAAQRRHGSGLVEEFVLCARRRGSLDHAVLRLPRLPQRPTCQPLRARQRVSFACLRGGLTCARSSASSAPVTPVLTSASPSAPPPYSSVTSFSGPGAGALYQIA